MAADQLEPGSKAVNQLELEVGFGLGLGFGLELAWFYGSRSVRAWFQGCQSLWG